MGQAPNLRVRLSQFESKLDALAEVVGVNTDVFAAGFDAIDRRIYTLMRIIGDTHHPHRLRLTPDQEIDWAQYFTEYEAMQALVRLAEVHGPACTTEEEETQGEDSATLVFGGDT